MFRRILDLCRRLVGGKAEGTQGGAGPAGAGERRVWVRHASGARAVVQATGNGVETLLSARVRNVSRGGISLVLDRPLPPGDLISIELPAFGPQGESAV